MSEDTQKLVRLSADLQSWMVRYFFGLISICIIEQTDPFHLHYNNHFESKQNCWTIISNCKLKQRNVTCLTFFYDKLSRLFAVNTNKLLKKLNPVFFLILSELNWNANLNRYKLNWDVTVQKIGDVQQKSIYYSIVLLINHSLVCCIACEFFLLSSLPYVIFQAFLLFH